MDRADRRSVATVSSAAHATTTYLKGDIMKISTSARLGGRAPWSLTTAACGGAAAPAGGDPGKGGPVTIGIKFDQPGLGLQDGSNYTGFDVEVAQYVAKDLGYTDVTFKESPSAQRETLLQSDQVKMIFATYSITDDRKTKVSFAGPYFVAGQDLLVKSDNTDITGPDALNGKKLCSVTGSTSAKKIKDTYATSVQLQEYDTYSKCVEALNTGAIDAVTTDNVILAGFAAQSQYQGKLKVVGKPFSDRELRRRHQEGRHRRSAARSTPRSTKMVERRFVAEGARRHGRRVRLQAGHRHQPAEARRLLLTAALAASARLGTAVRRPAGRSTGEVAMDGLRTLLTEYDVLGAFWMTIKLTFFVRHRRAGHRHGGRRAAGCPRSRCCGRSAPAYVS